MAYATTTELAEYLGVQVADLPDDADRLLDRASEMIDYYTLNRIDETEDAEVAKKATMAQYEWWSQFDEFGLQGFYSQIQIGPFQASAAGETGGKGPPELAPRARRFLFLKGLLYRGVDVR